MTDRVTEPAPVLGEGDLLALAQSAPIGLFVVVVPHGVVLVNNRYLEIVGRSRRDIVGNGWIETIHPDDLERVLEAQTQLRRGEESALEYRVVRPDGDVRWVRLRVRPSSHGDARYSFVGSLADVTEFKDVETAVRESERRFRALIENSSDIITVIDRGGTVQFTTMAGERLTGYTHGVGQYAFDFVHPDDVERVNKVFEEAMEQPGLTGPVALRVRHADGHWLTFETIAHNLLDNPDVRGLVITARDVTNQVQTDAALRVSESRLRDQASILEMIATTTPLDETLAEICRLVESQLDDARCTVLVVSDDGAVMHTGAAPSFPVAFARAIDGLPVIDGSTMCAQAVLSGETVVAEDLTVSAPEPLHDLVTEHGIRGGWSTPVLSASDGRVLGTFATYLREARLPTADEETIVESVLQLAALAIERSEFEQRLSHQAQHDPLTGLPNRALFNELLERALGRAQRSNTALAVLFLDLDRFKVVNDSLGHDAGDDLLTALADRLNRVLRPGDVVARFGGDEFTVLCEDLDTHEAAFQAISVAERLIDAVKEPVTLEGEDQFVSASVGIAVAQTGDERPEALMRDADAAMYRAKDRGRACCEVFDEAMRGRAQERHEIANALHRAVQRHEFRAFYQPMIDLATGECVALEALLRWQHPERGLLTPGDFLDAAEETGLIVDIGAWLLDETCAQAVEWRRAIAGRAPHLSVNCSARQLVHNGLADLVADVLERTDLNPGELCIEITETFLMEDIDVGVAAAKTLKALGVRVSMDDFGTGYSSLGYLRRFSVDEVKIDRSFVEPLGRDPEDSAIVAAVVSLGHALGVTVTGEGVESRAQLDELRALGVDAAQGFFFAPPQPADDLTPLLLRPRRWI